MFRTTLLGGALALALAAPVFAQDSSNTVRNPTVAGTLTPNAAPPPAATASSQDADATAGAAGPAKGANSFTEGQAQSRIADAGFADVGGLKKDADGIWRATASKSGKQVQVWLDYKGNVGQQ